MYPRLLHRPLELETSFFLFGPRGTGKTTWLKEHMPQAVYLDLLDAGLYTDLAARPERLRELVPPAPAPWVVIDEVQRVPEILNEVHRLIEERGTRFALTGSSARSLRRRGTNLLGGRALTFRLHPLTCPELGADAALESSLTRGRLPAAVGARDARAYLKSYVQTYLREEVQQEGLSRSIGAFARFLEAASFSQAAVLNVSEVARECGVERKTVAGYFQILEDLLLASTVPVFSKRAKRRMVSHSKLFFFDTGVYRALRPSGPLDRPEEIDGACLESLVYQEMRALNDYAGLEYHISYWRTAAGAEVDFVLYGERGILAVEVKRTRRVGASDLSGLEAFKLDYPEARCLMLYGGDRREYRGSVELVPLEEGLPRLGELMSAPSIGRARSP